MSVARAKMTARAALMIAAGAVASGAACPVLISDWIALGAGSCTLADGGTISNFRMSTSTTGTPTSIGPLAIVNVSESNFTAAIHFYESHIDLGFTNPVAAASSITVNVAYTITAPSPILLRGFQQLPTVTPAPGDPTSMSATISAQLCAGATFSSVPPGNCSGTLTAVPPVTFRTNNPTAAFTLLPPLGSADVFGTITVGPAGQLVDILQTISAQAPLPVSPTPAPASALLTLVGLAVVGGYIFLRRRLNA
jgi:hypothetical protein